jgi:hypothetical protein
LRYLRLKGKCLLVKGEIEKANGYFENYKKLNDSLLNISIQNKHGLALVRYQTTEKEKELLVSTQKNKLQQNTNNFLKTGLVLFSVLIFGLLYFYENLIMIKKLLISRVNLLKKD